MSETPLKHLDTPHGRLHKPKNWFVQCGSLFATFMGGPALGMAIGHALGELSENAEIVLYLPFVAIFFLGYGLWAARLSAIAFDGIGRGLMRALFLLVVRRKVPEKVEDVIPSEDTLTKMAVRAQQAAGSFLVMSVPVAIVTALASLFFDSPASTMMRLLLVGGGCVAWGFVLSQLGRRGFLPMMEEG